MSKTNQNDALDDFGRFSEPALLILISLAEGPKHGYSMTEDIESIADVRLGPETRLWGYCEAGIARLESRLPDHLSSTVKIAAIPSCSGYNPRREIQATLQLPGRDIALAGSDLRGTDA
jgi:hypothetical protein